MPIGKFDGWDIAVLSSILIISALIGIYYRYTGGKQKTTKEYLLANQSMTTCPVAFSLMASFMSAISLMGVSNEAYQFGVVFCAINLAYILSTPIAAYIFLPVFYRMRTTSVYEYLERRFGYSTRLTASLAFTIQMILYMGIALYAPALALEAVTGINKSTAILVTGLVCTFYSTLGGLKAVLITDVFQSILMFASIYAVIVVAAIKANGIAPIWNIAVERGRINLNEFTMDPTVRHSWFSLIIGGMFTYLSLYGVNQTQVQRLISVRNLKSAQMALWWTLPILSLLSFSTLFSGLAIFYYYRNCDPLLEGRIQSRDQLMPLFALDTMGQYPGLCGLFVSGIFSASLSTISSAITSLSAVTIEDYFKPLYIRIFRHEVRDKKLTLPAKIVACLYGLLCIGLAFTAGSMGSILQASLTIFGIVGGPLLSMFTLGICTIRTNQRGLLLGLLIGLIFSFWIGFGGPKPKSTTLGFSTTDCTIKLNETSYAATVAVHAAASAAQAELTTSEEQHYFWLYRLSYLWYSVLGFFITSLVGYYSSIFLEHFGYANNDCIYLDKNRKTIDVDLFAKFIGAVKSNHTYTKPRQDQDPDNEDANEVLTKLTKDVVAFTMDMQQQQQQQRQ